MKTIVDSIGKIFTRIKQWSERELVRVPVSLIPWIIFNTWLWTSLGLIFLGLLGAGFSVPSRVSYGSQMFFGIGLMSLIGGALAIIMGLAIYALIHFSFTKPVRK